MNQRPKVSVRKVREYTGHKGSIYAMAIDAAERYLYTSGDDGLVVRWDLQQTEDSGDGILRIGTAIFSLEVIEKFNLLVVGASDGTVYFVDLKGGGIKHTYRKTELRVFDLWYDPEFDYVWLLQGNGWMGVIDLATFKEVGYQQIGTENLRKIIAAPIAGCVLISSTDGYIHLLEKKSGKVMQKWQAHEKWIFAMHLIPDTDYLLSGGYDAHLNLWEWKGKYLPVQKVAAHNFTINDIALSPTHEMIVTASRDKTIKLWSADNLQLLKVVDAARHEGHKHSVNKIKWLKSDNSVISGSDDKRIIRWQFSIDP
ncbi:MAG: WD40 repeat domain-containing protein [Bacteroidia bacterium]